MERWRFRKIPRARILTAAGAARVRLEPGSRQEGNLGFNRLRHCCRTARFSDRQSVAEEYSCGFVRSGAAGRVRVAHHVLTAVTDGVSLRLPRLLVIATSLEYLAEPRLKWAAVTGLAVFALQYTKYNGFLASGPLLSVMLYDVFALKDTARRRERLWHGFVLSGIVVAGIASEILYHQTEHRRQSISDVVFHLRRQQSSFSFTDRGLPRVRKRRARVAVRCCGPHFTVSASDRRNGL